MYNKTPTELTAEEKATVLEISKAMAGIAVGATDGGNAASVVTSVATASEVAKNAVEDNYLSRTEAERKRILDDKAKAGTITIEEEAERHALAKKDNDTDLALIAACEGNPLSAQCHTERQKLEQAKFSYSGAEYTPTGYNYPTYTRYSDLYAEDYGKVASFSENYDVLRNAKVKANTDFYEATGVDPSWFDRADVANTVIASIAGTKLSATDPSKTTQSVPKSANANEKLPVVGKTNGYENQTADLKVSTGAENVALYPKLKDDLRSQQQAGFEKVIKDLNVKPQGSVLMLPDYRQKLTEAKSTLPPNLQERGNSAIASVNIDGLDTKFLAGHSQIDRPQGAFIGSGNTKFNSLELPNKKGIPIDRKTDSEYKIFSNLADQLGSNTQAKGQVTIFTERPACPSCLGVAEQFNRRYPNIKVNIFDNNGNLIKP